MLTYYFLQNIVDFFYQRIYIMQPFSFIIIQLDSKQQAISISNLVLNHSYSILTSLQLFKHYLPLEINLRENTTRGHYIQEAYAAHTLLVQGMQARIRAICWLRSAWCMYSVYVLCLYSKAISYPLPFAHLYSSFFRLILYRQQKFIVCSPFTNGSPRKRYRLHPCKRQLLASAYRLPRLHTVCDSFFLPTCIEYSSIQKIIEAYYFDTHSSVARKCYKNVFTKSASQ